MVTLFARLDAGLEGNDLSGQLSGQIGKLGSIASTVTGLINNPPQGLGDLARVLGELPLPDFSFSGDLAGTLSSLQSALPSDLSSVTGSLTSGLQHLRGLVESDIIQILQAVLSAATTLYRLTQLDLACLAMNRPGGNGAGGGGNGPGGGGGTGGAGSGEGGTEGTGTTGAAAAINQVNAGLDLLPTPLTVTALLHWFHDSTAIPPAQREGMWSQTLPLLDDLRDPLETLLGWEALDADGIRAQLSDTLATTETFIRSRVGALPAAWASDLNALAGQLATVTLAEIADDLVAQLVTLRTAVTSGDLSASGAAIDALNARLDQYETLRASLQSGVLAQLDALVARLRALPAKLENGMGHVLAVLSPTGSLGQTELLATLPESAEATAALEALQAQLTPITDWLQNLVDQIDLTAIQEPITTVAQQARGLVDGLDEGLVTVTLEVQRLFGELEDLLDEVDTEALVQQVQDAITQFQTELTQQLSTLFDPVRDLLNGVVTQLGEQVDGFDPAVIIESLRSAIQAVTDILKDPEVVTALEQIRAALDEITQALQSLSFSPLTDEVVAAIEEVTEILRGIDTSLLSTALQLALQAALAVLPEDLTPITNPLLQEFGTLVQEGPVPLLEQVQQQPARLLDRVRQFEPATLVGDALSAPFNALVSQMETFQPSHLVKPLQQQLDGLKERLRANVNPGALIEPLEAPFDALLSGLDTFKPETLVKPLQDALSDTITGIVDALPVDEAFDQLDAAFKAVQDIVGVGDSLVALLQRVRDLFGGLVDGPAQLDAWLDAILDKLEALGDTAPLTARLAALTAALDETRAAALQSAIDDALNPLLAALDALSAQTRLTALVQAYRGISRTALAALPDSPQKTALTAALDRFNPIQPAFGAPYRAMTDARQALGEAQSALHSALADWDARFQDSGVLDPFRQSGASGAQLRQWVQEALEPQIVRPLKALLRLVEPVSAILNGFATQLQNLITTLQDKLTSVLTGPTSLQAIKDAVEALVQRLRELNLDFLAESLNELFSSIRAKLAALDPANLRQTVEQAFNAMLDALDVGQVVAPEALAQLDATYAGVLNKLKALDPGQLVTEVVQPEFKQTVLPLLDTFDVTPVLNALIERLRGLKEELQSELARVNEAYRAMRDAAPGLNISLSLDIEVELPF